MVDCCRQIRRIVEEAPWGDSAHGFLVVGGEGVLVDSVEEVFRESPPILVGVTLTVLFVVAGLARTQFDREPKLLSVRPKQLQDCCVQMATLGQPVIT